jgi:hypothetical protein
MRREYPANGSKQQRRRSALHVGPKNIAHELGILPNRFRRWLRRTGKQRDGVMWTWSEDEARAIIAEYRNGGRRC